MTKHKDSELQIYEISEGIRLGHYRVIQNARSGIVAEHITTGEVCKFDYIGDKLFYRGKH